MAYIKHGDSRINLDKINEYMPYGDDRIVFYTQNKDGRPAEFKGWKFEDKESRDKALKTIDNIAKSKPVLINNYPHSTGLRG